MEALLVTRRRSENGRVSGDVVESGDGAETYRAAGCAGGVNGGNHDTSAGYLELAGVVDG